MKQIVLDSDMITNYNSDNKSYNVSNTNSNAVEKQLFILTSKNSKNSSFGRKKSPASVIRQSMKSKNLSNEKNQNLYRESLPQMGIKSNTSKHANTIDHNDPQFFKNGRISKQKRYFSKHESSNLQNSPSKSINNKSFHKTETQTQQNKYLSFNNIKFNEGQQTFKGPENNSQNKLNSFNQMKMNNFIEKQQQENQDKKEGFKRNLPKKIKQIESGYVYGESEDINRLRLSTPAEKNNELRLSAESKNKQQSYLENKSLTQKNVLNQYITKVEKGGIYPHLSIIQILDISLPQQSLVLSQNQQKRPEKAQSRPMNLDTVKLNNLQNTYLQSKNIRSFSSYSKTSKNQSAKKTNFSSEKNSQTPINNNSQLNHPLNSSFKQEKNIIDHFPLPKNHQKDRIQSFFDQDNFLYYLSSVEYSYKPPFNTDHYSETFRQHFVQTCQGIQYGQIAQPADPDFIKKNLVFLGDNTSQSNLIQKKLFQIKAKKTIIFDLDETLIHCNESNLMPADVYLPIVFPTGDKVKAGINVRPFCAKILNELSKLAEIIVFTASHSCYANKVIDHIDEQRSIKHRFFRENCVQTQQGVYVKDLRIFADRNLKDLVLIDNASYSFGFQVKNGIPIIPFYDRKDDQELKHLLKYLKTGLQQNDFTVYNEQNLKLSIFADPQGPQNVYQKLFLQQ